MAFFALRVLTVLAAAALIAAPARAQSLQRLTVTQLTLSADTTAPQIEQPFHLIVTATVRERISELDNLDLPILAQLELLGDSHTLIAGTSGTMYRETIEVVAHQSGSITIAPVTLDAIDARDGRAKRYSSNSLTLQVGGGIAQLTPRSGGARVPWIPVLFGIIAATVCWIVLTLRRRKPAPIVAPPPAALPVALPVKRDPRARVREWLTLLQARPDRQGAMNLRSVVRRAVGANDTQTLADVLQRPLAQDPAMRELLRALERAGFTHESDVPAAVRATIAHLEEMLR